MSCRRAPSSSSSRSAAVEAVEAGGAVEELAGQPADLAGVGFVPAAPPAQAEHRLPSHGPGVARPLGPGMAPDGVEDHSLAEGPLAADQLVEAGEVEHGDSQQGPGRQQVGPAGVDAGQGGPLRGGHAQEVLADGVELPGRHASSG